MKDYLYMRRSLRLLVLGTVLVAVVIQGYDLVKYKMTQASTTQAVSYHPGDVVMAWAHTFPHEGLLAATLTTEAFRDGQSPTSWAEQTRPIWEAVRFRYLQGRVLSGWEQGEDAVVLFESKVASVWGTHLRQEQYRLVQDSKGGWLIDHVQLVKEDEV